MLGRLLFSALLCALLGCASPGKLPAPATSASVAPPARGLFLYRVEPAHGGRASYLLGTIHLGFGFDEVLTPTAGAAFEASKVVVTETDLAGDPASRLVQAALLPNGQSLKSLLDADTWSALEVRLAGQIPSPVLAQMKPWLPAVLLGISDLKQAFDELRPGKSERMMDVELMARAERSRKQLRHLESVDEQIAVFEGVSLEEQISELKHALERESQGQARELVLAFDSADEARLTRALFDEAQMKLAPGFYQAVLFARNARWLPPVERALAEGDAFIAVGAAHLLGSDGLLVQLRKRGYQVARVE